MIPTPLIPNRDSQAGSDASFDATLRERFELPRVVNGRSLGRKPSWPKPWWLLHVVCGALVLIIVGQELERLRIATPSRIGSPQPALQQPLTPAVPEHTAPVVQPTPAPPPGWNADGTGYGRAGVIGQPTQMSLPRAILVKLPPPRAQFVAPPLGWHWNQTLPYGKRIAATYRGHAQSLADLPKTGNAPGDSYITAQGVYWFWTRPSGSYYQWIDP